jgi:hypothetical protein
METRWGAVDFSVRCTRTKHSDGCAGIDGLTETLLALEAVRSISPKPIKGVAIIFDSDDDPQKRFAGIIQAIKNAKLKYPLPDRLLEVKPGDPAIAISLIPSIDRQGNLDELIYESLQVSHADLLDPVNRYCADTSTRTGDWAYGKKSRMKLRCMIAASHKKDPGIALSHFLKTSKTPVDFRSPCFDHIIDFLQDFRFKVGN